MEIIRCIECNRKLAEAEFVRLSIKCPRCGFLNMKAVEPLDLSPSAAIEVFDGKSNHSVGRR